MPIMIHDKPWLLVVFAAIGFVITWLIMPRRSDDAVTPALDTDGGFHQPTFAPTDNHPRSRGRRTGSEDRIARERLRRTNAWRDETPPPSPLEPPRWCVLLGVDPGVDRAGLRKAYVAAIKNVHPDCIGPDCPNVSETCAHLAEAYALGRAHIRLTQGA